MSNDTGKEKILVDIDTYLAALRTFDEQNTKEITQVQKRLGELNSVAENVESARQKVKDDVGSNMLVKCFLVKDKNNKIVGFYSSAESKGGMGFTSLAGKAQQERK